MANINDCNDQFIHYLQYFDITSFNTVSIFEN